LGASKKKEKMVSKNRKSPEECPQNRKEKTMTREAVKGKGQGLGLVKRAISTGPGQLTIEERRGDALDNQREARLRGRGEEHEGNKVAR